MTSFERITGDLFLLKVPFGNVWTGIILAGSKEEGYILIDSANCSERIDDMLIPALTELGIELSDIKYLLCTHTHGDHVGGHLRIKELAPDIKALCTEEQLPKLRDPLKYSKLIRSVFPEHSPAAPGGLRGIEPDGIIKEGDVIGGRMELILTPGHDSDAVCFFDRVTKTVICGDSLQANGTPSQGIGLYMDLEDYNATLGKLSALNAENLVASHSYTPFGDVVTGKEKVSACLKECEDIKNTYHSIIKRLLGEGKSPVEIVTELTKEVNATLPAYLFLPLYTVTAHIRLIEKEN